MGSRAVMGRLWDATDLEKIIHQNEYESWRALRKTPESEFIALVLPRFIVREPYSFDDSMAGDSGLFANSAYLLGVCIARAFVGHGWCARIHGVRGGLIEDLPRGKSRSDEPFRVQPCVTEVPLSERIVGQLLRLGLTPSCHIKNTSNAVFPGVVFLHKTDPVIGCVPPPQIRLTHVLVRSRLTHYLQVLVRDRAAEGKDISAIQESIRDAIADYVLPEPSRSSEELAARKPLSAADLRIEPASEPGLFRVHGFITPHFQLEAASLPIDFTWNGNK
jgi:type VI secretion system protein ImpC